MLSGLICRSIDAGDNLIMMLFTEFGRRVHDNGTGTDHGAGGAAFVIGNQVKGGHYSEYPSLQPEDLVQGDLAPNYDFRGFYSTVVEQWLGLDPVPIVGGHFEQLQFRIAVITIQGAAIGSELLDCSMS